MDNTSDKSNLETYELENNSEPSNAEHNNTENFGDHYADASFWQKIKRYAIAAGKDVIEKALTLYYCLLDVDTPAWAKTVIVGALGYFIVPADAIPDLTPLAGYSDDLGALVSALAIVASHIKLEHQERAQEKLKSWFGDIQPQLAGDTSEDS